MIDISTGTANLRANRDQDSGMIKVKAWVKVLYGKLCGLTVVKGVPKLPHAVVMAKFWQAMRPFYPAEVWKCNAPLVEATLFALRKYLEKVFHTVWERPEKPDICARGSLGKFPLSNKKVCQWPAAGLHIDGEVNKISTFNRTDLTIIENQLQGVPS